MSRKYIDKNSSALGVENLSYLEHILETEIAKGKANSSPLNPVIKSIEQIETSQTSSATERKSSHTEVKQQFKDFMLNKHTSTQLALNNGTDFPATDKLGAVVNLIESYRLRGHQIAKLDPLGRLFPIIILELNLEQHGLSENDLDTKFSLPNINSGIPTPLRNIVALLKKVYCSTIGYEYNYIMGTSIKNWMQNQIRKSNKQLRNKTKIGILERIIAAEGLEKYLHNKFTGHKRFSLEGSESVIVALDGILKYTCLSGYKDLILGMAHRGRLNVLINIFGKNPIDLIKEFEGKVFDANDDLTSSGDVKYHQGFANNVRYRNKIMHISLAFNPSHLQIVYPVVEGSVRARQDMRQDSSGNQVIPVVIHGDAAFAGQGVNMETMNMIETRGYSTKGTIHIVINNQIGFTTSNAKDARSTFYCTDIAKMVNAPILHVNGDDPEAVLNVAKKAVKYRNRFHNDIVIDLYCYRRHGHNEGDEPSVTQPMMYKIIKKLPTLVTIYGNKLIEEGVVTQDDIDSMKKAYRKKLDNNECTANNITKIYKESATIAREKYWSVLLKNQKSVPEADTRYPILQLKEIALKLNTIRKNFTVHSRVAKILEDRKKMAKGEKMLDWGAAENLAYATLLTEDFGVRVSGQDSGRGTFFHRHAVLHDNKNGKTLLPLSQFETDRAKCLVIDSLLSEEAVLAFEYGYTTTNPFALVVWEAQFGDFANNAQVVIDQFITSGQAKWGRLCGLVMLLPHGFEGQGPEHSSARLERYLQLCAEFNMVVVYPTLPAQIFHLLRLQMKCNTRKPLIVMAPKSILRNPEAVSRMEDLAEGAFQKIIDDNTIVTKAKRKNIKKIVLCTGKVYYDLHEHRKQHKLDTVAIVRIEQLYPFPRQQLSELIASYSSTKEIVWCQEEPRNQGAWFSIRHHLEAVIENKIPLSYTGRTYSASTAVGYAELHKIQQAKLVEEALADT